MPTPPDKLSLWLLVIVCLVAAGTMLFVPAQVLTAGLVYQGF